MDKMSSIQDQLTQEWVELLLLDIADDIIQYQENIHVETSSVFFTESL